MSNQGPVSYLTRIHEHFKAQQKRDPDGSFPPEYQSSHHPDAVLLILLVDERPEEVSEAISWGVGEVGASSFDMPAQRHTEVAEMVLERS